MNLSEGLVSSRVLSASGVDAEGHVRHIAREVRVPPSFMAAPIELDWKAVCVALQNRGNTVSNTP